MTEQNTPDPWGLTPHERRCVELLLVYEQNKAIAAALGVTHRTVEHHLASAMKKMEAGGRVRMAVKWDRFMRAEMKS